MIDTDLDMAGRETIDQKQPQRCRGAPSKIVWRNARLATLDSKRGDLGLIERGAVASEAGRINYVGAEGDLPRSILDGAEIVDAERRLITPGLIDCHTHLIYAGNRAREFELRLNGASYEQISKAGGGIVSSVKSLRAASEDQLLTETLPRLDALLDEGLTTIEVKSGYGLDLDSEIKTLRVARRLAEMREVSVQSTYLGAHVVPPEMHGDKTRYINCIVDNLLPAIAAAGLADAVDGFCEGIAFSAEEIRRVFDAAKALGLPVKLHADQLSNLHGAALAASYGALSADHLEFTDEDGAKALAAAGTVAVLLPGAFYFLRETKLPPVATLRAAGVPMAIATDSNPGTSPLTSLLLAMNMSATLFRLTVEECIAGVTREAARALGMQDRKGALEVGKDADLAIWDAEDPAELVYRIGFNPLWRRVFGGHWGSACTSS